MDFTILKPSQYKEFNSEHITLKDVQCTNNKKNQYTIDLYHKRRPLLVITPTLTVHTNMFQNDMRGTLSSATVMLMMRNIEWEKSVQDFYHFLSYLEHATLEQLRKTYEFTDSFQPVYSIRTLTETEEIFTNHDTIYSESNRHLTVRAELRSDISEVYTRFQKRLSIPEIFSNDYIRKNARVQCILEIPRVWFEMDAQKRIDKLGFHWTILQMKIIEQTSIPKCIIGEEVPVFNPTLNTGFGVMAPMCGGFIPPPPPPPLPMNRPGSSVMLSSSDLLGGLSKLKNSPAPPERPKPRPGQLGISLEAITNGISKLRKTESKILLMDEVKVDNKKNDDVKSEETKGSDVDKIEKEELD